jgi:hypothetical protein
MQLETRKAPWEAVYLYPIDCKDGDVAWRMLHNRLVAQRLFHQWIKRVTDYCPRCHGTTGSLEHMFFDCPMATILRNRLTGILRQLLGTHDNQETDTVLAKIIIYNTYMVVHDTQMPTLTYHQMMRLRI